MIRPLIKGEFPPCFSEVFSLSWEQEGALGLKFSSDCPQPFPNQPTTEVPPGSEITCQGRLKLLLLGLIWLCWHSQLPWEGTACLPGSLGRVLVPHLATLPPSQEVLPTKVQHPLYTQNLDRMAFSSFLVENIIQRFIKRSCPQTFPDVVFISQTPPAFFSHLICLAP